MAYLNEQIFYPEKEVYHVQTGSNGSFPDGDNVLTAYAPFPATGSIPVAKQLTGDIETDGNKARITAPSGLMNQITIGDYIYDNGIVRKIVLILSETDTQVLVQLEAAFPANIAAGSDIFICKRQTYKKINLRAVSGTPAIQGTAIDTDEEIELGGAPFGYSGGVLSITATR